MDLFTTNLLQTVALDPQSLLICGFSQEGRPSHTASGKYSVSEILKPCCTLDHVYDMEFLLTQDRVLLLPLQSQTLGLQK